MLSIPGSHLLNGMVTLTVSPAEQLLEAWKVWMVTLASVHMSQVEVVLSGPMVQVGVARAANIMS